MSVKHINPNCQCASCKAKRGEYEGENNPFWNKHHTQESKEKIGEKGKNKIPWNKGKVGVQECSQETREKMSNKRKGNKHWNFGNHWSEETKIKISESEKGCPAPASGENHWWWKGGKSREPYPLRFDNRLKEEIRERDNYECQFCGRPQWLSLIEDKQKLTVHHIDFDKNNIAKDNLITLCRGCNLFVNFYRKSSKEYFKELLNEKRNQEIITRA